MARTRIDRGSDRIEIRRIFSRGVVVNRPARSGPSNVSRSRRTSIVAALALLLGVPVVGRVRAEAAGGAPGTVPPTLLATRSGERREVGTTTGITEARADTIAPRPPLWALTWSDEFDGPAGGAVSALHWNAEIGDGCDAGNCGWGNEEKQRYTSGTENAALTGSGMLAITARRDPDGPRCYYGPCRYTSAKLTTRGKVTPRFGRVEARIRIPTGQGLWPAFWMLGAGFPATKWPDCGELDIMEHHGSKPGNVSSAMHGPGYSGNAALVHEHTPPGADFTRDFHRYAVEWDSAQVRFSVDDVVHFIVRRGEVAAPKVWAFDHPFYIILNLAVGGTFDGDPASDAVLPATMLVDYVRVYERQ
ncbi:MAG: glycoside hydrolase family 16 protein [Gemmatimonadetes bacterium]|nr:glycoside hydrolase family 16 protein [Gemmatimonadota bacterium]MCC6771534.1 glycoside hydrolase family 16 protein [Gemmatimonadaceae bacterium]